MFGGGVWVILFKCFWYTCRWKKCMKMCVSVFKMLKRLLEMPFIDLLTCLPRTYTNSLTCWLVGHLLSLDSILFTAGVGTEKDIQHAKDQSYSLVDVLQRKCLLRVMKYTLQTWNRNLLQYLNIFQLTNFIC